MAEPEQGRSKWWFHDEERIRARFRVPIELAKHIGTPVNERVASPADLSAFAKEQPERARELHALRASSVIVSTAGVVGAVASGLVCYRASRAPQYALIGFFLGGLAASAGADDVSCWVYGRHKFDLVKTEKAYWEFMNKRYPETDT